LASANCKKCGAALPSAGFGELSEYCTTCQSVVPQSVKRGLVSELPRLAEGSIAWPAATILLIAISTTVFVAMVAKGVSAVYPTSEHLLHWGANYGPYTLGGQYWRLVTASFLHVGLMHLALNMVSLWILGRMVEKIFGGFITCGLYLLTAIGAGLLTISWDPVRVSAGASGAIFGFDGVLIAVLYYGKLGLPPEFVRRALGWVVKIALINLLYGLRGNVDNMAHLGGLVTGLLAGVFLARTFSLSQERLAAQTRVLAVTTFVLLLLLLPIKRAKADVVELQRGEDAMHRRDYNSAIEHYQKYTAMKPDDAEGHASLGYAFHAADRLDDAVREYQRALALNPDTPWVEVNLADIYAYQKKPAEAVALYQRSISKAEAGADEYRWYGSCLYSLQRYADAENALQKALALDKGDEETHRLLADVYAKLGKTKEAQKERQLAAELDQEK